MSYSNIKAEIYDTSSVLQGTITRILKGTIKTRVALDEIGEGGFGLALDDTQSRALVARNLIAILYADTTNASGVILQQFIIVNIKENATPDGRAYIDVSGPGLLHELTYRNLGYTVIDDGAGGPASTPEYDILAFSDNSWTLWVDGAYSSYSSAYIVSSGESVWEALMQLAQSRGSHLGPHPHGTIIGGNVPNYTLTVWNAPRAGSGSLPYDAITISESPTGAELPILDIEIIKEPDEVITRAYFYGAGNGTDRFTLADVTSSDPTGFTTTAADSLIVNTALEAVTDQPVIARVKQFPNIKPADINDATAVETAANALHQAGIQWLQDREGANVTYYRVKTLLDGTYFPGQYVHLTYSRVSPYNSAGAEVDTTIINVDDDFILLEMTTTDDGNGLIADMVLGSVPRALKNGSSIVAQKLQLLDQNVRHATSAASTAAPPGPTPGGTYLLAAGSPPNLTGNMVVSAGVTIDGVDISAHAAAADAHHDSVTLNAAAATLLTLAGGGQQIELDTQTANTVLAGPASGGAAVPAFRAMVEADLPSTAVLSSRSVLAGSGLTGGGTLASDVTVTLGTPGTNSATSSNAVTASSHTHTITTSSNPGASAIILASDTNGALQLVRIGIATTPTTSRAIDLRGNYSGADFWGVYSAPTMQTSHTMTAVIGLASYDGSATGTTIVGVEGRAKDAGSYAAINLRGVVCSVYHTASATLSLATAVYAYHSSTGDITNVRLVDVNAANQSGSSPTITNLYGVFIGDVDEGTNNFAIYTGAGTVSLGDDVTFRQAAVISTAAGNLTLSPDGYVIIDSAKTTTGDPTAVEGLLYWNTADNAIKMYADGAWRTLASW